MTNKPDYGKFGGPWEVKRRPDRWWLEIGGIRFNDLGEIDMPLKMLERVCDCVNACAGLTDEELKRVRAVNELYEALKNTTATVETLSWNHPDDVIANAVIAESKAAIAKAEGGDL